MHTFTSNLQLFIAFSILHTPLPKTFTLFPQFRRIFQEAAVERSTLRCTAWAPRILAESCRGRREFNKAKAP